MVIRRIRPLSAAKISGVIYAILGLILGAGISLLSLSSGLTARGAAASAGLGAVFGAAAIVAMPIIYGVIGFVSALVGAWLYNLLAGMLGGIEMEVE